VTEFQLEGIADKEKIACHIVSPSRQKFDTFTTDNGKESVKVAFTPAEEGNHEIELTYDGLKIPGFPYGVNVSRGSDPTRVKVNQCVFY